ncbi:MAG: hypothetical protein J6B99_09735 [Oscillospiraceae bacterium]|nr:hypothetical protein [Oscillospiraceae bacterium]
MPTKRKIIFDDYDTAANGLWTLAAWALSDAEPVTNFIDVPGRLDGPLDASTALTGDIQYSPRTLEATLESSEGTRLEREERIDYMVNKLHGQRVKIWLPDDADHYLVGRLRIKKEYNDLAHAAVKVTGTCEPWRYENDETVVRVELNTTGRNLLAGTRNMSGYYRAEVTPTEADDEGFVVLEWSSGTTATYRNVKPLPNLPFAPLRGRTVTLSFDVRSDDYEAINAAASQGLLVSFATYAGAMDAPRIKYKDVNLYSFELSAEWQRVTVTATLTDDLFYYIQYANTEAPYFNVLVFNTTKLGMQVRKLKLELGSEATDWSPAPEDGEGDAVTESITTVLPNDRRPACPVISSVGENILAFNSATYALSTGIYQLPDLQLTQGEHTLTASGSGLVSFVYRRAVL